MAVLTDYKVWREPALTLGGELQDLKKEARETPGPQQLLGIVSCR